MKWKVAVAGAGLLLALGLSACASNGDSDDGGEQATAGRGTVRVVAGFYPLYEAAQRVGGDRVQVRNLTPAGVEPHDLELTPKQVDRIEDADLVLYFGRSFQPAIEDAAGRSGGEALDLLEGLALAANEWSSGPARAGKAIDPHVWLDPELMRGLVDKIRDALVTADPGGRADFERDAEAYARELEALDSRFSSSLRQCSRTVVVTSHAAFGYLTRRYGLTQEPIAGFSPESEPDPQRLGELADLVRRTGTTTVYYETLVSSRVAQTLARESGVETAVLNPLEGLTEEQAKAGATYVSIMDENRAALIKGLGCA